VVLERWKEKKWDQRIMRVWSNSSQRHEALIRDVPKSESDDGASMMNCEIAINHYPCLGRLVPCCARLWGDQIAVVKQ
jgi:hypothetical protein